MTPPTPDEKLSAACLQRDANAAMAYAKIVGEIRLQLHTGIASGGEDGYHARRLASELETALTKHANALAADAETLVGKPAWMTESQPA